MEIDLELDRPWAIGISSVLIALIVLFGLAGLGQRVTPVSPSGDPRIMTWSDWNVLQLKRAHNKEIALLRKHVEEISTLLNLPPDPIAAQVLYQRVHRDVQNGLVSTADARRATLDAADKVLRWSTGQIDRDEAVAAVEQANGMLK
jgi:hypothetical protein